MNTTTVVVALVGLYLLMGQSQPTRTVAMTPPPMPPPQNTGDQVKDIAEDVIDILDRLYDAVKD